MNKFTIAELPETNKDLPILYEIHIGSKYYLHKGKTLKESLDKVLDDVFRGIRDKNYSPAYSFFVKYCKTYPALHRVSVNVVLNDVPKKVLAMEDKRYKQMQSDECTLNNLEIKPYKPEWMLKEIFQERCATCIPDGIINGKKLKFKFCPNCGKSIK